MISPGLHLSGLWPPFAEAVRYLLAWADSVGYQGELVSGYRSQGEQLRLYRIGRTLEQVRDRVSLQGRNGSVTDAWPGESPHQYGLAVDVEGPSQQPVVRLAHAIGFGTVSWDPAHVEWPNWRRLL